MSQPQPTLRPTQPATLVVAGLSAAAVAWLLISNFYQDLPPMIWPTAILIAAIAAFEGLAAWVLWGRIHGRGRFARGSAGRRPEPVDPLVVVRYVVLAKASSLAGAILAGAYGGFVPWLAMESGRVTSAAAELPPTIGGLVASMGLIAAALWLEYACRVPKGPDEDEGRPGRRPEQRGSDGSPDSP
ncbi:MAG TPA: DUF3180 domain-containing protein [Natronosporangium sp.]|jgi:hypothetical protein|nr:DUF3180 domain-containing protein [Natronosporangium sp.]